MSRKMSVCVAALIFVMAWFCMPAMAGASERATLKASFSPDRPGASTTIEFAVHVSGRGTVVPSPLLSLSLRLPAGLNPLTTTLGLADCPQALLERDGLQEAGVPGCSRNSIIGYGSGLAQIALSREVINEEGVVTLLLAPEQNEQLAVLFYLVGAKPLSAQLVFPGELLADSPPFSLRLNTTIPAIPTWPGGPVPSIVSLNATIGPRGVVYQRHVGGKTVPYHPRGLSVPSVCPPGGYPFAATLDFLDGSVLEPSTTIPCKTRRSKRHSSGH
jgi:hypothetical protein